MRSNTTIKLLVLFIALGLVLWASIAVRKGSMDGFFVSLTGADPAKQINLCPNRIHRLTFKDQKRIEEIKVGSDLQWRALDPDPRPLNYLGLEKWLGERCYIAASLMDEKIENLGNFETTLKIDFIDQSSASLMQNSAKPDVYSWDGRLYNSPAMTSALKELRGLAGWN